MLKEFFKYAIPSALAMFISSLYTVIDGIFVGQGVGDMALAAINIVLPFTVMLFGLASMFAIGGGSQVSKYIGAGESDKAVNIFRQVFKFLLILSGIISLICIIFTEQIVSLLGATEGLKGLAVEYLRFYAIFCIPNLIGIVLSSFVRNDGRPKLAMISTILGAITNIILDYLFIFEFGFGIKGAAIATGLGQIITVAVLIPHFIQRKGYLSFGNVKLNFEELKTFSKIGFPSFFAQASYSVIVLIHNVMLVKFIGEAGISAYSIINYITTNTYMVLYGLTLGAQPLISYNYGKKDGKRMLGFYKITSVTATVVSVAFIFISFVFGPTLIGIFTSDPQIASLAYLALRIASFSYLAVGINLNTLVYFQALEKPKYSNLSCVLRSIIYLPLALIVLCTIFGANGIWAGTIVSEVLTLITISILANVKGSTHAVLRVDQVQVEI
ncbi:MATE family efflux transporter [Niameybacter massiliensis]|uniref:Multidrug export protein MepA n=1 Tax=Holtiella tumoricola TaxID=3018743 RepID=A0AA42DPU4_9FIRM|nr:MULTISPECIES: MATE family efflux transporter [Lachnospirales]MDA3732807.1 MATE family efflux transporter [Holtiella tumoricola]